MKNRIFRRLLRPYITLVCRKAHDVGILSRQQAIILHSYLVNPYDVSIDHMDVDARHVEDRISDPLGLLTRAAERVTVIQ